ncbi:hypothetical protein G5V59_22795 [Nocardioides sp. W3-2-3]|uniref:hypothetical protein n=1 Tax=Nocardioides convexus TaxID=2712224 RepID=UPI0024189E8D|nr:hypothetical protein [Nocardioides convexus]NHA01631.1 hypothetical protein [Nocardioides convexus]
MASRPREAGAPRRPEGARHRPATARADARARDAGPGQEPARAPRVGRGRRGPGRRTPRAPPGHPALRRPGAGSSPPAVTGPTPARSGRS